MRKIPHFLKKIPIFSSNWGSEIGSKYANFSDFWALLPDPETTSLIETFHPDENGYFVELEEAFGGRKVKRRPPRNQEHFHKRTGTSLIYEMEMTEAAFQQKKN